MKTSNQRYTGSAEFLQKKTWPQESKFNYSDHGGLEITKTLGLRRKIPRIYINGGPRRGLKLPKLRRLEQPWEPGRETRSSSSSSPAEAGKKVSLWDLSRKQKLILAGLALGNVVTWMSLALLAPFFPQEAENRGVSQTVSGWIFGVFSLTQFFFCPLYGKLAPIVGVRFSFLAGLFVGGTCTILFGVLDLIPTSDGPVMFIVFCFLVRICCAAGCSACFTTVFTMATVSFPDNTSSVLGLLETAVGVGLMIGPALGGVLYEFGGFQMPFLVLGSVMVATIPAYICVLPSKFEMSEGECADGESKESTLPNLTLSGLARIPSAVIVFLSLCLSAFTWVTLDPILAPHLQQFNLSASLVGLVFLLLSGSYGILAPIVGYLTDKLERRNFTPFLALGFVLMGISLLLIGPSPLIGLEHVRELWLNLVSLVILGLGLSLTIVPTFDKILRASEKAGYKDNVVAHGIVAGVWTSMFGIGETMGPVYGGGITASDGFEWCMTYVALMCFAMALLLVGLYVYEEKTAARNETEQLQETMERSPFDRTWSSPDLTEKEKKVLYNSCSDESTPLLGTLSI